jgi:hypothetical protein
MNDNRDPQLDALFRAARIDAPETARAEYGFETRLLARLREERGTSIFTWAWRLCPFFAVLAISAAFWTRTTTARVETTTTMVAEATRGGDETLLMSFMTGNRR